MQGGKELSHILCHLLHSTITSWTRDRESDAFKNMLEKVYNLVPILSLCSTYTNIFCPIALSSFCIV